MITAPTYSKIILLVKTNYYKRSLITEEDDIMPDDIPSTVVVEYEDCGMVVTGNYIIIAQEENKDDKTKQKFTDNKIYQIEEIESFRLYNY
jgi:hypothetical protein